ncbi:glycosyltransferase [Massilia arenosa]|uniref:Glycosyltransferase n=1 Tax=Zemynaea arenosa TaxID=2561931 RepID=A0A4Y9SBU4_9BURK|nr:glycosyltransferase family 4 protein [Massilia arenosa]TFW17722.1 glycosyltransferase [Massilia arenosa]
MRPLNILTWHTHGSYLYYLAQAPHNFFVVSRPGRLPGYGRRCGHMPWGANVIDLPASEVRHQDLDCILYQDDHQYLDDRDFLLSPAQQRLPAIYLEHEPPRGHPTDTRHLVEDPDLLLVHVTPFNALMWDSGRTPCRVVEYGVIPPPQPLYTGELARGLVVINQLARRGRWLGADLFEAARAAVPLDLAGMEAEQLGGLGEVRHAHVPAFMAAYRFFFNPIRYASLGLAVIEAMLAGLPVVALATAEMATVIDNGRNGYADTRLATLVARMRTLLAEPGLARELGREARAMALERFHIARFVRDWNAVFADVTCTRPLAGRDWPC